MHTVRQVDAPTYDAPGHFDMFMRRLQGMEAGPSNSVWIGLSVLSPNGHTLSSASPQEKFYIVVSGNVEVTATLNGKTQTLSLGPFDSCRIEPGEERRLANRDTVEATVLLIMPLRKPEVT